MRGQSSFLIGWNNLNGDEFMRMLSVLMVMIVISGCSPNSVVKKTIILSGAEPLNKKVEIIQSIVSPEWVAGLKKILMDKYSGSNSLDIDKSLDIRVERTEMKPFDSEARSIKTIGVACTYNSENQSLARKAAETCGMEIKKELTARNIEFEI